MDDPMQSVSPTVLESAAARVQQHDQNEPPNYFLVDSESGKKYLFVLGGDIKGDINTAVIDDMKKQMTDWNKLGQVQLGPHSYDVFE